MQGYNQFSRQGLDNIFTFSREKTKNKVGFHMKAHFFIKYWIQISFISNNLIGSWSLVNNILFKLKVVFSLASQFEGRVAPFHLIWPDSEV